MEAINVFEKVMDEEAEAIIDVKNFISHNQENYLQIVSRLLDLKGHLIFMGVGKSGHIGEKLAATFASTGTPSFFVHATEAMHGDLGMVTNHDLVILISNSGETKEALAPIKPIHRIGAEIIAMTKNPRSSLAQEADYLLEVPVVGEADQFDLAPTKSSTAVLATGDALALTLSELKGFNERNFAMFHPGGALGQRLLKEGLLKE
jgi:arabinose-5-phosphate isomerase